MLQFEAEHLVVDRRIELRGIAKDGAKVLPDGRLHCVGTVLGDLVIEPGGEAIISGVVRGNVENNGSIDVHGIVTGKITGTGSARLRIGSQVDGKRNYSP